jgi:hypothetical protein
MKKTSRQLDAEIAEALLHKRADHARKRKPKKSADEIRFDRLKTLKEIMADAVGEPAWRDTDIFEIEKWISVDDDLSDPEWLDSAKNQLADQSVLPEHAGAAPASVYRWNDAFISTYCMKVSHDTEGHVPWHERKAVETSRTHRADAVLGHHPGKRRQLRIRSSGE